MNFLDTIEAYMERPNVYLAGPMRGFDNYNFETFFQAAGILNMWGFRVKNPAEMDLVAGEVTYDPLTNSVELTNWDEEKAMQRDFDAIRQADAVVFLPGWEKSVGAKREFAYASAQGIPCYQYDIQNPISLGNTPTINAEVRIEVTRLDTPLTRVADDDDLPF